MYQSNFNLANLQVAKLFSWFVLNTIISRYCYVMVLCQTFVWQNTDCEPVQSNLCNCFHVREFVRYTTQILSSLRKCNDDTPFRQTIKKEERPPLPLALLMISEAAFGTFSTSIRGGANTKLIGYLGVLLKTKGCTIGVS